MQAIAGTSLIRSFFFLLASLFPWVRVNGFCRIQHQGDAYSQLGDMVKIKQRLLPNDGGRLLPLKRWISSSSGFASLILLRHLQRDERIHPKWDWTHPLPASRVEARTCTIFLQQRQIATSSTVHSLPVMTMFFLVANYAQIELRVLAHMSKWTSMANKIATRGEFHFEVAVDMFPHVKKDADWVLNVTGSWVGLLPERIGSPRPWILEKCSLKMMALLEVCL